MSGAIEIGYLDLAISALLVLVAGLVSMALRLDLGRRLAVASLRTVVQLLLVGYVLKLVFGAGSWYAVLGMGTVMILAAARAAVRRPSRRFAGAFGQAFLTLLLTGLAVTITVTALIIRTDPWYQARYFIPLLGMILGNGLTGISLGLDTLLAALVERRHLVESDLALGASAWEAARPHVQEAVRRGMIPIINSMMVVGIVSLPGMMTGQILAGADPLAAVKYQIVVMFMVAGATALGTIGVVLLAVRSLFNARHQLRADAIAEQAP